MDTADGEPIRPAGNRPGPLVAMAVTLVAMWVVELVDAIVLGDRLQRLGIGPRTIEGLIGIPLAPLLHADWGHLVSNSVPFVALGWLVGLRGLPHWLAVTAAGVAVGGGLTWLLAGGTNHIGASGVVFAYFGALLGGAYYDRRPALLAPALVALFLYGGMLAGIVPQDAISWEGHLFGMVAGVGVARLRADPPPPRPVDDGPRYPWELDEPWLDEGGTTPP